MNKFEGTILVIISAIGYGLMPFFAHFAAVGNATVETMLLGRFFITFLLLVPFLLGSRTSVRITLKQFFILTIITLVGLVATTQMLFYSYRMIPISRATALHFIYPVAVVIYAVFLKLERITWSKIIALFLGVIGVWFLVNNSTGEIGNLWGVTFAIFSGITYAVYVVGVALPSINRINIWVISFYTSMIASISYFCLAIFRAKLVLDIAPVGWGAIIGLAIFSTFIAQLLFIKGVAIIGPFRAAVLSTFEPLVGILMGLIVFHEVLGFTNILGVFLIVSALVLVILGREKSRKKITNNYKIKVR